ncbi:MAG: hypothetical protein VX589_14315 [Myxococcota bacterium]|nr:hypothetical protein [Myxococcota bacterium]
MTVRVGTAPTTVDFLGQNYHRPGVVSDGGARRHHDSGRDGNHGGQAFFPTLNAMRTGSVAIDAPLVRGWIGRYTLIEWTITEASSQP